MSDPAPADEKKKRGGFQARRGFVVQAYTFALDPGAEAEDRLRSHCGAARTAYNWAVGHVLATWAQRIAEASYGISEEERTPWRPWSLASLRKTFNAVKRTDPQFAGWWADNSKEAYNTGLAHAAAAFDNYAARRRGERAGPRVGAPRFKAKRRARPTCRFTTGTIRVEDDRRHVTLPRLGTIRTHENTRKLQRRLANKTARILSATVSHQRGRWQVAFQVEVQRRTAAPARPEAVVGVDLGVATLAVVADTAGNVCHIDNPRHLGSELVRLRRACRTVSRRQGPDRSTGRQPSRRWRAADAERTRIHHRIANLRTDAIHKLTTSLAAEYGTVVVEDLNVAGMLKNRRLARSVADAGFGEIRRQLAYKTGWGGGRLMVADRWFPSSKTCSRCGTAKAKLPLSVRTFTCDACGLSMDRDHNAAVNLAALAACTTGTGVAGDRDAQASKPRRADHKTRTTRRNDTGPAERAGGAEPAPRGKETRDRRRTPDSVVVTPARTSRAETHGMPIPDRDRQRAGWRGEPH
ncbi:IS607 family element RNA-guided endonuclease TnpB [Actinomadura sp. 6K520]|uniref:IS607 family element RNA-guided endonuclease TnpB n=1 Tax=Actinomadura sp. 6K520 TaxID=2530364 RepID=UPI001FB5C3DD|nr:IS607 family element RNA-guided endonuclease TnpB [Actinomadura sp. 6K520]